MTDRPGVLALVAVIVIAAAMIAAGPNHSTAPAPQRATTPTTEMAAPRPAAPSRRRAAEDPAVAIARTYALTARNWTAASYRRAWRRQLALSTGRYHRQLRSAQPTRVQLRGLAADAATSRATATRAQRGDRAHASQARVLVWLAERTHAAGHTIAGTTRNEVHLQRGRDGRWRVTDWTALPGPEATP